MAQLYELFANFEAARGQEDWERGIKILDKILDLAPGDSDALKCKLVCLARLEKWDEIVNFTQSLKTEEFLYERLYALYKLKKYPVVIAGFAKAPKTARFLSLRGQLYQMDRHVDAAKVFQEALAATTDSDASRPHILTNLAAALVKSKQLDALIELAQAHAAIVKRTYDLAYNIGTAYLEKGDLDMADKYLDLANSACQVQYADNPHQLEVESVAIRTQKAVIQQKSGKVKEATAAYIALDESKPDDQVIWAVVANNLVTLRGDQDRFDSLRKLGKLRGDAVQERLTSQQKEAIGFNQGLLLFQMNKIDECRELVKKLQEDFPKNDLLPLLTASMLVKEHKVQKSQAVLEEHISKNPASSDNVRLSMAQMHLNNKNVPAAVALLENIDSLKASPGYVATVVSLFQQIGDLEGSIRIIDRALNAMDKKDQHFVPLLRKSAELKMAAGKHKEAATSYKMLYDINNTDMDALCSLIMETSFFDPDVASKYEAKIPSLQHPSGTAPDAAMLENLSVPTFKRKEKVVDATASEPEQKKRQRKKKKRKNKLPKNPDPSGPDPERWVPKYERSTAKGKKMKNKNRGAQGAISASQAAQVEATKQGIQLKKEEAEEAPGKANTAPVVGQQGAGKVGGRRQKGKRR